MCECVVCVHVTCVCSCVVWHHASSWRDHPHRDLPGRVCAERPQPGNLEQVSASRCFCDRAQRDPEPCGSWAWMSLELTHVEF